MGKDYLNKSRRNLHLPISSENEDYSMVVKMNDNAMPNKERKEAFIDIVKIIESVMQSLKTNKENKNLMIELKRLSEIDRLTNIYNRMMLDKILLKQKNSYDRYNEKCSVILVDIDHFKRVNDVYGHNVGDQVIYEVSSIFKNNIRKTDVVGRWGVEEFLVICEHTDLCNVMILAEALRKKIEDYSFTGAGKITASFGVSEFTDGVTIQQVIGKADEALYKAKTGGRNKVSD